MSRLVHVRLFRHQLACSWRSLSMCSSTAAVAQPLYIRERAARARVVLLSLPVVFFLVWRLCSRRVSVLWVSHSALPALCFRLCFAQHCFCSALLSALVFVLVTDLLASLVFISASATPLTRFLRPTELIQYSFILLPIPNSTRTFYLTYKILPN